ncbi:MAG: hypothetical protein ACRD29_16285 [Acidimicrobiales bacterium]
MGDGLDVSRLSPSDAATAFRSLARRFTGLFTAFEEDESPDALLNRPGPDGRSAAHTAADVGRRLAGTAEALRLTAISDRPEISLSSDTGRVAPTPEAAADLVAREAERLANQVDATDADAWARTAIVDGHEATALDLVRQAVRTASDGYRAAERAVAHARRHAG